VESLDRARDQVVGDVRARLDGDAAVLTLDASDDTSIARWVSERHLDQFERAFGRPLRIVE
jgi:hypothetical protein